MSQLFKNLKSIFVVESKGGANPKKAAQKDAVEAKDDAGDSDASTLRVEVGDGEINQKFTDILLKAIEDHNQEGFDYIEYKRSLQNLFKMNLPEETMYKSAYAAAQTMGATPGGLVSSAEQYLEVLNREQEKFQVAIKKQRAKQIDGRVQEMKQIQEGIRQKEARIKELQAEVGSAQQQLTQVEGSIETATAKVETTGRDFQASFGNLVGQIRGDIENIKKHLA